MLRLVPLSSDIASASNSSIRCRRPSRPKAKQGLERSHRLPPPIVTKDELVEVNLKLCLADPMVRSDQPLLEVPDGTVREGHDGGDTVAQGARARLSPPNVSDARRLQVFEAFQAVGHDCRPWADVLLDELDHRRLFEIRDHRHPDSARDTVTIFDRCHDDGRFSPFELTTASQTGLLPTDPGVIELDVAVQRLARRVHHRAPQFVQQHPGRFVATKPQLPLEQERGDPALVGGHEIPGPEPHGQRHLRVVKNRSGGERDLVSARNTSPASVFHHRVRPVVAASRTPEPVRPTTCGQILLAGFLGRELALKLTQVRRKRWTGHPPTLYLVAC
jgi:hypothetical protein